MFLVVDTGVTTISEYSLSDSFSFSSLSLFSINDLILESIVSFVVQAPIYGIFHLFEGFDVIVFKA